MRTKEEIDDEVKRLMALRPASGPHLRRVTDAIAESVEELERGVDDTCEEFSNEPSIVQDAVHDARRWKNGGKDRPSKGFGKLVESD